MKRIHSAIAMPSFHLGQFFASLLLMFALSIDVVVKGDTCIEVGESQMVCTENDRIIETRLMYDTTFVDVGVTQRVDGSDEEKQAVKEVLKQMDRYFFQEVLALPQYHYARSKW
jgi:hypothetical protein